MLYTRKVVSQNKIINSFGITLIELVLVIAVIGILVLVTVGVINVPRQQQTARDATIRQNLSDTASAIETYRVVEGEYPEEGTQNNPLDPSASTYTVVANYIGTWVSFLRYNVYDVVTDNDEFSLHAQKATDNNFFKYTSTWQEIRECPSTMNEDVLESCL